MLRAEASKHDGVVMVTVDGHDTCVVVADVDINSTVAAMRRNTTAGHAYNASSRKRK